MTPLPFSAGLRVSTMTPDAGSVSTTPANATPDGGQQRMVEPVPVADDVVERSRAERPEGVGEAVAAAVGGLVGKGRRSQQVQAQQPALGAVPVLAVVEQGEAAAVVLRRDPLVGAHLELRALDRVALGRRPVRGARTGSRRRPSRRSGPDGSRRAASGGSRATRPASRIAPARCRPRGARVARCDCGRSVYT